MKKLMIIAVCVAFFSGCGSGGNTGIDLGISQNFSVDDSSSHTLQVISLHVDRKAIKTTNPHTFDHAVSYADFDQDGDIDIFMSSGDGSENETPSELYLNDGNDNFTLDTDFFNGSPPGQVHPRKALTGDFNGDDKMDVFVIGHGYDQPPYPGEAPYLILSSNSGFTLGGGLSSLAGFHHGGASADIDADGDLDVFLADTREPTFLINDGAGNFTTDTSRLSGLNLQDMYTAELVDVDNDGYVDLLVAGHEPAGFSSKILWGDSTGFYSTSKSTTLPAVTQNGTVIDIDVADIDLDGDKDIVLNRTGDGTGALGPYQGYYLQVVENTGNRKFVDKTQERFATGSNSSESWIDWIRLQDFNSDGHIDVVVDDAARNLVWYNDGSGNFQ
ncbi:VCBS repeat-containing protein [Bermanella marisrubri]|uniref:VCBS repeat-containing protein n=1 Tax=Bermanella marisrubri TaxID=207949 RepID=Q1N5Q7_9GAMM|nr:VCBS repeat-containing protein [Bermanella marisrubri]EAT13885.1 hypothetical protein RED65_10844 [Oceanobacter sp. RED65] [Bermanella marisrubri]QIZ84644.1 VCBS repeat-containing protein [Bermanella marisrubri]